jgi:hypothetical protein
VLPFDPKLSNGSLAQGMSTEIVIVVPSPNSVWHVSAEQVKTTLGVAIRQRDISDRVDLLLIPGANQQQLSDLATQLSYRASSGSKLCVICHLEQTIYEFVAALADNCCWIFVSGGRSYLPNELKTRLSRDSVIWFQGAYGRESNFAYWLEEWQASGFAVNKFSESSDILLTGKRRANLLFERFCQSLIPLIITLESFGHFSGLSGAGDDRIEPLRDEGRSSMYAWLSDTLRDITEHQNLLHNLSAEATLIDGMIRNKKLLRDDSDKGRKLRELLTYFVPSYGGHATIYNPPLDDDLRKLIKSDLDPSKIDECVLTWLNRLRQICSFLDAKENVPQHDASKSF